MSRPAVEPRLAVAGLPDEMGALARARFTDGLAVLSSGEESFVSRGAPRTVFSLFFQ